MKKLKVICNVHLKILYKKRYIYKMCRCHNVNIFYSLYNPQQKLRLLAANMNKNEIYNYFEFKNQAFLPSYVAHLQYTPKTYPKLFCLSLFTKKYDKPQRKIFHEFTNMYSHQSYHNLKTNHSDPYLQLLEFKIIKNMYSKTYVENLVLYKLDVENNDYKFNLIHSLIHSQI